MKNAHNHQPTQHFEMISYVKGALFTFNKYLIIIFR